MKPLTSDTKEIIMDDKFCFSCAMPIDVSNQTKSDFCQYCTQPDGRLKPKEEVMQGIAGWMKMWQPDLDDAKARQRAGAYMNGMPAWAEN
jgi:hypothetical protein